MPHPQNIPAVSLFWEHLWFEGRRIGTPGDGNRRRYWGVLYAGFPSEEAADAYPEANPVTRAYACNVRGELVDRFFWDEAAKAYTQTEQQVGACLHWFFTGNPTEAELALTDNMQDARAAMAGTTLFGAFAVTALPTERTPEEEEENE